MGYGVSPGDGDVVDVDGVGGGGKELYYRY